MPPRRSKAQRARARRIRKLIVLVIALALAAALVVGGVSLVTTLIDKIGGKKPPVEQPTEDPVNVPQVVATATVGNSGDILIHTPVLRSAKVSDGVYDFEPMFRYMGPYVKAMDYAQIAKGSLYFICKAWLCRRDFRQLPNFFTAYYYIFIFIQNIHKFSFLYCIQFFNVVKFLQRSLIIWITAINSFQIKSASITPVTNQMMI